MQIYGATDKGLVRKSNQDNYVMAHNSNADLFAIVCDGIGGGLAGDVASKTAIDYFSEMFAENKGFKDEEDVLTWLRYHIHKANELIFTLSTTSEEYKGMGTTMVAILHCSVGVYCINIGDSRCYGVTTSGDFACLTQDHSLVQDMVNHGEITEEQASHHPRRNILTNALGIFATVKMDIQRLTTPMKTLLLCSDGLHGYVEDSIISKVMMDIDLSAQNKCKTLLNLALKVGGFDNVTIVLIEEDEVGERYE